MSPVAKSPRFQAFFGLTAACSLVMCFAAAALWVRSVTVTDQLRSAEPTRQTTLISANGELCVQTVSAAIPDFEPGVSFGHASASQFRPPVTWDFAGFGGGQESFATPDGPIESRTLMFPLWPLVVLLAIPPALCWGGRRGSTLPQPAAPTPAVAQAKPARPSATHSPWRSTPANEPVRV